MLLAIPLGFASDRIGRKRVMLLGVTCFAVAPVLYSLSSEPFHLILARAVLGIAKASTFSIGFVYISEISPQGRKGISQGFYLTSMGIGFTLGPLIGGMVAKAWGYSTSFYISSGFAVFAFMALLLTPDTKSEAVDSDQRGFFKGFREVLSRPEIIVAGTSNFFNSMLYNATMVYFPVYGDSVGLDESQVGVGLTVRGLSSTAMRIPSSTAVLRLGALRLMSLGIGVSALTIIAVPRFDNLVLLSIILGIQGISYGMYLTSGNVYITEEAPKGLGGAAIGVFSTFSNLSGIVSPIVLGMASEAWGIRTALRGAAVVSLFGVLLTIISEVKRG
jgi:MFS family permease